MVAVESATEMKTTEDEVGGSEMNAEQARTIFLEGKRAYLAGNYAEAAEKLSDACTITVDLFGLQAAECFDPHLYYGKSLLELSRMEPGVFSNALTGIGGELVESDDEDESGEEAEEGKEGEEKGGEPQFASLDQLTEGEITEIRNEVNEALAENAEALESGDHETETDEKDDGELEGEGNGGTHEEEEEEGGVDEGDKVEDAGGADLSSQNDETAGEELPHLQLAWEVLEVARSVCDRQEGRDWQERKTQVLLVLGDVSIEDENYKQALDDLGLCLEIQKAIFEPHDRRIAECHFQTAQAYKLSNQFEQASIHYAAAVQVLKQRIEFVTAKCEESEQATKSEFAAELKDLQALIPEIEARIVDAEESAVQFNAAQAAAAAKPAIATMSDDVPARDISALIRKPVKRSAEVLDESPKRAKNDENAHATSDE